MKKFFLVLLFGFLFSGNGYAVNIFDCEIKTKDSFGNPVSAKIVIKVDDNSSAILSTEK